MVTCKRADFKRTRSDLDGPVAGVGDSDFNPLLALVDSDAVWQTDNRARLVGWKERLWRVDLEEIVRGMGEEGAIERVGDVAGVGTDGLVDGDEEGSVKRGSRVLVLSSTLSDTRVRFQEGLTLQREPEQPQQVSEQKDQSQSSLSSRRGLNEPSGKVPSTMTSCRAETTPGMTCLLPSMSFPSCIRSATECFPSRMNSCSCDAIRAVASVWLSLRPRASRFWAMQPTWRRRVEQGEESEGERGRGDQGQRSVIGKRISRRTRPRDAKERRTW